MKLYGEHRNITILKNDRDVIKDLSSSTGLHIYAVFRLLIEHYLTGNNRLPLEREEFDKIRRKWNSSKK